MEIKFEHVSYIYPKQDTPLFDDLSISFPSSKVTAIIGPAGSGKSTILGLIRLKRNLKSGEITVGPYKILKTGMKSASYEYESNIGYVGPFPEEQFTYDSVEKEFSFLMEKYHYPVLKRDKHIHMALNLVGLDDSYLLRDPFSLSNGEARLIALAIALSYNPKVILLDEPTIGMNKDSKKMLLNLLTTMKKKYKKTILLVSQDIDFVSQVADDVLVLKDGKIVLYDDKKEVFKHFSLLKKNNVGVPRITELENYILETKKVRLGHRFEINDLVKDILRKS